MSYLENIMSAGQNPSFVPPSSGTRSARSMALLDPMFSGGRNLQTSLGIFGPEIELMASAAQDKADVSPVEKFARIEDRIGSYPTTGSDSQKNNWIKDAKLSQEEGDQLRLAEALMLGKKYEQRLKGEGARIQQYPPGYDGGGAQGQPTDPTHPKYGQGIARDKTFWEMDFSDIPSKLGMEPGVLGRAWETMKSPFKDFQIYSPSSDSSNLLGARGGVQEGDMSWSQQFKDYQGPSSLLPEGSDVTKTPDSAWDAILQAFHLQPRGINPDSEQARRFAAEQKAREDAGRPRKEDTIWGPNALNIQMDKDDVHLMKNPLGALTGGAISGGAVYPETVWNYMTSKPGDKTGFWDRVKGGAKRGADYTDALSEKWGGDDNTVLPSSMEELGQDAALLSLVPSAPFVMGKYGYRAIKSLFDSWGESGQTAADKLSKITGNVDVPSGGEELDRQRESLNTYVSREMLEQAGFRFPPPIDGKIEIDVYDPSTDQWVPTEVDTKKGLTKFVESIAIQNPTIDLQTTGPGGTVTAKDIDSLVRQGLIKEVPPGTASGAAGSFANDPAAPRQLRDAAYEAEQRYNRSGRKEEPLDFYAKMLSQTMGDISDIREKIKQTEREVKRVMERTPHWLEVVAVLLVEAYAASVGQSGVGMAMLQKYTSAKRQEIQDIRDQQTKLLQLMGQQQNAAVNLYGQMATDSKARATAAATDRKEERARLKPFIDEQEIIDRELSNIQKEGLEFDKSVDWGKVYKDFVSGKPIPIKDDPDRKEKYEYSKFIKLRAWSKYKRLQKEKEILGKISKLGQEYSPAIRNMVAEIVDDIEIVDFYDTALKRYRTKGGNEKVDLNEPRDMPPWMTPGVSEPTRDPENAKLTEIIPGKRVDGWKGLARARESLKQKIKGLQAANVPPYVYKEALSKYVLAGMMIKEHYAR